MPFASACPGAAIVLTVALWSVLYSLASTRDTQSHHARGKDRHRVYAPSPKHILIAAWLNLGSFVHSAGDSMF